MENLDEFNNKVNNTDYSNYRNNFKDKYTFLEKYCKENYKNKNVHSCLPQKFNFLNEVEILNKTKELINLEYIKDNNYGFIVNPSVQKSTDLLRAVFANQENENINKVELNKSLFQLLKQIRDNLIHDGKFELEENQFNRNFQITKISSEMSDLIINKLNSK